MGIAIVFAAPSRNPCRLSNGAFWTRPLVTDMITWQVPCVLVFKARGVLCIDSDLVWSLEDGYHHGIDKLASDINFFSPPRWSRIVSRLLLDNRTAFAMSQGLFMPRQWTRKARSYDSGVIDCCWNDQNFGKTYGSDAINSSRPANSYLFSDPGNQDGPILELFWQLLPSSLLIEAQLYHIIHGSWSHMYTWRQRAIGLVRRVCSETKHYGGIPVFQG